MSKTTITIPHACYLAAATLCTSTDETRYNLNGVLLQYHPEKDKQMPFLRMVSTNGHRMFLLDDPESTVGGDALPEDGIIFHFTAEQLRSLKLKANREKPVVLEITDKGNVLHLGDTTSHFEIIDGKYPNYGQIIPAKSNQATCKLDDMPYFNTRYMEDFGRIVRMLSDAINPALRITPTNGLLGPIAIDFGNVKREITVHGVLMPLRV